MPYDYPISRTLSAYGPFKEDTHFFGEGLLFCKEGFGKLANGKSIQYLSCSLEVAYTRSCEIIVICYLDDFQKQPYAKGGWGSAEFRNGMVKICDKFVGRDIRARLNIVIERLSPVGSQLGFGSGSEIHYRAECYRVSLPVHRAARIVQQYKEVDFDYAEPDPYFEISGLDTKNTDPIYFAISEFDEHPEPLTLRPIRKKSDLSYPNQTIATLTVPDSCCSNSWTNNNIADFWCGLYSLAIGKDIQWTSRCQKLGEDSFKEQMWYSRHLAGDYSGHAFISFGQDVDGIRKFIYEAFVYVTSQYTDYSKIWGYVFYLRAYIHYLTLKTSDATGTSRLLATLTEALLHKWERNTDFKVNKRLKPSQLKCLRKTVNRALEETPESYDLRPIAEEVSEFLNQHINEPSLRELLEAFFKFHEHDPDIDNELKNRIIAFCSTRNAIAHDGTFAWMREEQRGKLVRLSKDEATEWFWEAQNVKSIIPLMLFCLFGYKGEYFDPVGFGQREWLPTVR